MTTDYGSPLFAALRSARQEDWAAYTMHAFPNRMGDGTLPRASFLHYLRQDYVFLIHFARAWALAVVKSDRIDEMRQAAAAVHALIDEEMRLHIGVCAQAGIDEATLAATPEAPANLAYTRFVLDAGARGDLLDLLIALAPCVLGYGEIGARLTKTKAADTPYGDWIATYGGAEYQEVCHSVAGLIETVAARRIGATPEASPRWAELRETFAAACRLEADFWTMGLNGQS